VLSLDSGNAKELSARRSTTEISWHFLYSQLSCWKNRTYRYILAVLPSNSGSAISGAVVG